MDECPFCHNERFTLVPNGVDACWMCTQKAELEYDELQKTKEEKGG
tara:strand:- start:5 stop:142 length:138 start_codon:yes stop_codon:yes gene_type:complete